MSIEDGLLPTPWMPNFGNLTGNAGNHAGRVHRQIIERIRLFEAQLSVDEEIGAYVMSSSGTATFHITAVGSVEPQLIVFRGLDEDERPVELVQHYTQLSVCFMALPKAHEDPRRIGFTLKFPSDEEGE